MSSLGETWGSGRPDRSSRLGPQAPARPLRAAHLAAVRAGGRGDTSRAPLRALPERARRRPRGAAGRGRVPGVRAARAEERPQHVRPSFREPRPHPRGALVPRAPGGPLARRPRGLAAAPRGGGAPGARRAVRLAPRGAAAGPASRREPSRQRERVRRARRAPRGPAGGARAHGRHRVGPQERLDPSPSARAGRSPYNGPLTPAEVHAALAYFYDNRDEIEAEFAADEEWDKRHEAARAELLSRRPAKP